MVSTSCVCLPYRPLSAFADSLQQLSRHLNRLQSQLELLTPNVPPLPTLPSFNVPTNIAAAAPATSSHYGGVGSAAAAQAANAYNPTAHVGQFVNPYAQGYGQQYGYGTPVDSRFLLSLIAELELTFANHRTQDGWRSGIATNRSLKPDSPPPRSSAALSIDPRLPLLPLRLRLHSHRALSRRWR